MNHSSKLVGAAIFAMMMAKCGSAIADEPIVGDWKTESGETAAIAPCGNAFCITLKTGQYAGKRIGNLTGNGSSYSGTITDPADSKEYSGSAKVSESSIVWSGDRKPGKDGKLPAVGNTVDVKNASWTNTIGASELGTVWTDPLVISARSLQ